MLKYLYNISNNLDKQGKYKNADAVDRILLVLAQTAAPEIPQILEGEKLTQNSIDDILSFVNSFPQN